MTSTATLLRRMMKTPNMLLDPGVDLALRMKLLTELCQNPAPPAQTALVQLLERATAASGEAVHEEKVRALDELIRALEDGPLRAATFIALLRAGASADRPRAHVRLQDGTSAYPLVPDAELAGRLERGDAVLLSARAEAVVARDEVEHETGEEGVLETVLDELVEVSLRASDERHLLHAAAPLVRAIAAGRVERGARLVVCTRRGIAWRAVPEPAEATGPRFRFRDSAPVPDVRVGRDLADPPAFIEDLAAFCREEMTDAAARRAYGLRRCRTLFLRGGSGTGKSHAIAATIRRVYEVVAEQAGLDGPESVPSRVLRLRSASLLSKYLGDSDKNAERFVQEIAKLSAEPVRGPKGEVIAPVIAVLEELDGIARERGTDHEVVHDRIQTTMLQLLDPGANPALRDRIVIVFATSNVPHLIDAAWLRRVSDETYDFGRLTRRSFAGVLDTHLRARPVAAAHGADERGRRRDLVGATTAALFAANGADPVLLEIGLAGQTTPLVRRRRDFLTASIVDRAVERAAARAHRAEVQGAAARGIAREILLDAIDDQVRAVAGHVTAANAHNYVDLPEGTRVATVRRLPSAPVRDHALVRA